MSSATYFLVTGQLIPGREAQIEIKPFLQRVVEQVHGPFWTSYSPTAQVTIMYQPDLNTVGFSSLDYRNAFVFANPVTVTSSYFSTLQASVSSGSQFYYHASYSTFDATQVTGNVGVTGDVSVSNQVSIAGNVGITNPTVTVAGAVTVPNTVTVQALGPLPITGSVTVVSGNITVNNIVNVVGSVAITGNSVAEPFYVNVVNTVATTPTTQSDRVTIAGIDSGVVVPTSLTNWPSNFPVSGHLEANISNWPSAYDESNGVIKTNCLQFASVDSSNFFARMGSSTADPDRGFRIHGHENYPVYIAGQPMRYGTVNPDRYGPVFVATTSTGGTGSIWDFVAGQVTTNVASQPPVVVSSLPAVTVSSLPSITFAGPQPTTTTNVPHVVIDNSQIAVNVVRYTAPSSDEVAVDIRASTLVLGVQVRNDSSSPVPVTGNTFAPSGALAIDIEKIGGIDVAHEDGALGVNLWRVPSDVDGRPEFREINMDGIPKYDDGSLGVNLWNITTNGIDNRSIYVTVCDVNAEPIASARSVIGNHNVLRVSDTTADMRTSVVEVDEQTEDPAADFDRLSIDG